MSSQDGNGIKTRLMRYPKLAIAYLDSEKTKPDGPDPQITNEQVIAELKQFRDNLQKPINCWMCNGFCTIMDSKQGKIMASWMWHFVTCRCHVENI